MPHRIEVGVKPGQPDPAGVSIRKQMASDIGLDARGVRVIEVYTIAAELTPEELERARTELFTDPVTQISVADRHLPAECDFVIEVGYRPGVTDNVGRTSAEGLEDTLGRKLAQGEAVYKSTKYAVQGVETHEACDHLARDLLANDLIQRWVIKSADEMTQWGDHPLLDLPVVTDASTADVGVINLDLDDAGLMALSKDRMLALELPELKAIQRYYQQPETRAERERLGLPAEPTDIELEILAQTWSEHCKHKIFNARITYTNERGRTESIHSLFQSFIKATTDTVAHDVDWLLSVFHDNAGIIRFDDEWNFALKVETHNSPSALDPYGGAITGIVGVNRDILGAGLGCKCVLNTDVFCFASPDWDGPIPPRLFHPRRVLRGVHQGVQDGGNQSGIPVVNGAIVFHERFLGKPLVFCGTGGMIPAEVAGRPSHEKAAKAGDSIIMCGGRIGKDGIHGATFSSEALHEGSPATAVQIGDPITQKKMADFLLEARDLGLFNSITDNGAGGLSSSVGEMARDSGGCEVHLDKCPLKYAGLAPWEIFLSEAQERMTLAVPPGNADAFIELASRRGVEATVIGSFTDSGRLECYYEGKPVAGLSLEFLHKGLPTMDLKAVWRPPSLEAGKLPESRGLGEELKAVLARHNVCSKESLVRMYDHEVLGQSVLKPFQGEAYDGPGNASVIRPVYGSHRGIAIACGLCPKYSDIDTYHMMACAIDEALRNLVCVGAAPGSVAGLDNFCWPDPVQSEATPDGEQKLGQLVRCCEALRDVCVEYGIPLISGKDSMKNDYRIGDMKISIPPTVLFTAAAIVEDARKVVSMDVKAPGHVVYVLGETRDEMGGSEYLAMHGQLGMTVPKVHTHSALARYQALNEAMAAGLVASCHDCSDGGLGVALAETAFAGGHGVKADLTALGDLPPLVLLFSESQSRFVVTVEAEYAEAFEAIMIGHACYRVGEVTADPALDLTLTEGARLLVPLDALKAAWQAPLRW